MYVLGNVNIYTFSGTTTAWYNFNRKKPLYVDLMKHTWVFM